MLSKPGETFIKEGAQNVTEKDVAIVVSKSDEIQKRFSARGPLARFIVDSKLLISLVKDYWSRAYRQIPYGIIASAAFTLMYVFNPFDILDLSEVEPGEYDLVCLPLRIEGGDGAPARVILRPRL